MNTNLPEKITEFFALPHSGVGNGTRFAIDKVVKSVLYPSAFQVKPDIRTISDPNAEELQNLSFYSSFFGEVSELGFYFLERVRLRGRGHVMKGTERLYSVDLVPRYIDDEVNAGKRPEIFENPLREQLFFPGHTVLLSSEGYPIFGHWLVDIIPKAWLYTQHFGEKLPDTKFLLCDDTPKFGVNILKEFFDIKEEDILFYNFDTIEPVLEKAIMPSLMNNNYIFHPAMLGAVQYMIDKAQNISASTDVVSRDRYLYVSRSKFRSISLSSKREIANEAGIISIAMKFGFEIVYPEDHSFSDQIRMFQDAKVVIGESGSGLHNAIFSSSKTVVLCLSPSSEVQGTIASLKSQKIVFLCAETTEADYGKLSFQFNLDRFTEAVSFCMRLSQNKDGA